MTDLRNMNDVELWAQREIQMCEFREEQHRQFVLGRFTYADRDTTVQLMLDWECALREYRKRAKEKTRARERQFWVDSAGDWKARKSTNRFVLWLMGPFKNKGGETNA